MFWLLGSTDWEEFVKRQGSSELKIAAAQVVTNRSQSSVALPDSATRTNLYLIVLYSLGLFNTATLAIYAGTFGVYISPCLSPTIAVRRHTLRPWPNG